MLGSWAWWQLLSMDVVSRTWNRRLDATVQIIVNSYHMLPRGSSPYHALSYLSPSHTIGYNARVELLPPLREKAPLNICFNSALIPNRTAA
jgi:hypothetical protein